MQTSRLGLMVIVVGLVACGGDALASIALKDAGELARDAAEMLDEMADGLGDAGKDAAGTARAEEVIEIPCDKEYAWSQTVETANISAKTESWTWLAEVKVDTANIVGIDVRACGREVFDQGANTASCTPKEGVVCTGEPRPAIAPCFVGLGAEIEPRLVRVQCGTRLRSTQSATGVVMIDSGSRFTTVKLTIRR